MFIHQFPLNLPMSETSSQILTFGFPPFYVYYCIEALPFWIPPSTRRSITWEMGGVPVHQDPVHGIVANREKWQWALRPFSISGVCDNPVHRVMVNWYPLIPAGWEAGPNHHGHYGTRFAVFSCTQQPKNLHLKPVYFLQYLSIQDSSLQSQSQ